MECGYELSRILVDMKKYISAHKALQFARELDEGDLGIFVNLILLEKRLLQIHEKIDTAKHILEQDPNDVSGWGTMAACLLVIEEIEAAEYALKEYRKLASVNHETYDYLTRLFSTGS